MCQKCIFNNLKSDLDLLIRSLDLFCDSSLQNIAFNTKCSCQLHFNCVYISLLHDVCVVLFFLVVDPMRKKMFHLVLSDKIISKTCTIIPIIITIIILPCRMPVKRAEYQCMRQPSRCNFTPPTTRL